MHYTKSSSTVGLGAPFTFSPEDFGRWPGISDGTNNTYLGYNLEKTCLQTPYVPFKQRPRQGYVLAKSATLFRRKDYILRAGIPEDQLESVFYETLAIEADLAFVGHFDRAAAPDLQPPSGIINLAEMPSFDRPGTIAQSRVLVGLGSPRMTPDPWEALCLGVPFINPVRRWDRNNPKDRSKWESQHDALIHYGLDEPYVYHVKVGDEEALKKAIIKAMETPIDR